MYRINHTLSTQENFVGLANDQSVYPFVNNDFVLGGNVEITPIETNNYSNAQVDFIANEVGRFLPGQTTIQYRRFGLAENRPSAGNKLNCDNTDTHESIEQKIVDRHRLVKEEIVFTRPSRFPIGGETLNYTLNPVENSAIYTPGSLTIEVKNRDKFKNAPASYFWGDPIGEHGGLPVYHLPPTNYRLYSTGLVGKRAAFMNLVNLHRQKLDAEFDLSNITLGTPIVGGIDGYVGNTLVQFTPATTDPLLDGGYFFYTRPSLAQVQTITTSDPDSAYYRALGNTKIYPAMRSKRGYPSDEFSFVKVIATAPSRTVEFLQILPSYVFAPNEDVFQFVVVNP